jgi:hypothetical protein
MDAVEDTHVQNALVALVLGVGTDGTHVRAEVSVLDAFAAFLEQISDGPLARTGDDEGFGEIVPEVVNDLSSRLCEGEMIPELDRVWHNCLQMEGTFLIASVPFFCE